MRFSYWPAPTMPWTDLLEMSRHAEATGLSGVVLARERETPQAA